MSDNNTEGFSGRLDKIALSLSGGGVRAVGFHLGTMSMLERLGLMDRVEIISSVSGGSMPGIGYSLSRALGRKFQDFFDDFYEFLPQLNLIEEMMKLMTRREAPGPSGRRDLISSFANIYQKFYFEAFFEEAAADCGRDALTFDLLMDKPKELGPKEMTFNATEFKTGSAFRFQVSEFRCLIGNRNIALCRNHARQIRLADIMAASSCIPVGMEPLFFPDDFHWPDDKITYGRFGKKTVSRPTCEEISHSLEKKNNLGMPNFALMDGGVYDNQGLGSTLNALNRRKEGIKEVDSIECGFKLVGRGEPWRTQDWANWVAGRVKPGAEHKHVNFDDSDIDLLIVSDTPLRKESLYPRVPLESEEGEERVAKPSDRLSRRAGRTNSLFSGITLGQLSKSMSVVLVLLSATALLAIGEWWLLGSEENVWWSLFRVFHIFIPLLLVLVSLVGLVLIKVNKAHAIESLRKAIPNWNNDPGKYIDRLRLGDILKMGMLRGGSVSALTSTIYMNRIRSLGYAIAFSRDDIHNRIISNEVFTLQIEPHQEDEIHDVLQAEGLWPPTDEMQRIIQRASSMPTKLWIEREETKDQTGKKIPDPYNDLDYLVAAGQSTICYNLLEYMWEKCRDEHGWLNRDTEGRFMQAKDEWSKLMKNPWSLLEDRKSNSRPAKLNPAIVKTA